jgi:hypothetical protein
LFDFLAEYAKPLLMFGVSIAGSSIQGAITKHKTGIDNDRIPVHTGATWGTAGIAAGQVTDDPLTMVAGFAGATVSSIGHKLIGKLFGG